MDYEQLKQLAQEENIEIPDYVKAVLKRYLQSRGH